MRLVSSETKTDSRPLMKHLNILNVCQINILQTLTFVLKSKLQLTPKVFLNTLRNTTHKYPTAFATNNLLVPEHNLKSTKCII